MRALFLVVAFCVLIYLSWYHSPLFIFIAWAPLFKFLSSDSSKLRIIFYTYCLFLGYNLVVTYWLIEWNTVKGSLVIVANAILMELVVIATLFSSNNKFRNLAFLVYWFFFEYIHHIWDFSWPWLTLGNTFSSQPIFIQWYSFTGVLGGSLWVLTANLWFYKSLLKPRYFPAFTSIVFFPLAISITIYLCGVQNEQRKNKITVGVVTTNFTNYTYFSDSAKLAFVESELESTADSGMNSILLPETYFRQDIWMDGFEYNQIYNTLKKATKKLNTKIICGFFIKRENKDGYYVQNNGLVRFDQYNTAIQIDTSNSIPIKIKKKFIPIQEYTPTYLNSFYHEGYGNLKQLPGKDYFESDKTKSFISICYESVNSVFFSERWTNENVILMLSSESFLNGNRTGMIQYQNICRLRAIEFSKFLFKSSNCGLSSMIDERGNIIQFKKADELAKLSIWNGYLNQSQTFYSKYGWLINRIPLIAFAGFAVMLIALYRYERWHK